MNTGRLSPSEALSLIQKESIWKKYRLLVVDYLLRRSSYSSSPEEQRAWWMLYSLLAFVETRRHFPYKEELYLYLDDVLRRDKGREIILPAFSQADLLELKELEQDLETFLRHYAEKS
jgi:hypothetical protein